MADRRTVIYDNPLTAASDLDGFILEGRGDVEISHGGLELRAHLSQTGDRQAHCNYWCPQEFPADIEIEWEFTPLTPSGLCMLFFAATGRNGEDLFDPSLPERRGYYDEYHSGAINAFHVSYYRRTGVEPLHVSVLRKSAGFHRVAVGADPLPGLESAQPPYQMRVTTGGGAITFHINDLLIHSFTDDGLTYGPRLGGGKVGFRQMDPMVARYANLRVHRIEGIAP